jgi:DNA (cytosine-5)-methyltransferase 1
MARLHGFPDWFRLHSTKWHGARQIGNAVPPPMARAIAAQVMHAIGKKPIRPEGITSLGDSNLLSMEMSSAASHFDVLRPSGKRDRKSGAKKRKQWETEIERLNAARAANG